MRIFIAGGSGAIGRQFVPMLVLHGHHVVAMTRTPQGAARIEAMGATAVIGDVFDDVRLTELARQAAPELVIHQLTAFGATDADPLARPSVSGPRARAISWLRHSTRVRADSSHKASRSSASPSPTD